VGVLQKIAEVSSAYAFRQEEKTDRRGACPLLVLDGDLLRLLGGG
jgi:hypothetical protein